MAVTDQQCHAMTTYYVNACREATGTAPVVNRNAAKSGWKGMLIDFSPEEVRAVVDYYVSHYTDPRLVWFLYNYEKVVVAFREAEEDRNIQTQRRSETQKRLEEWRKRWQK